MIDTQYAYATVWQAAHTDYEDDPYEWDYDGLIEWYETNGGDERDD